MIFFTKNLNEKKIFFSSGGRGGRGGARVSEYSLRRIQIYKEIK